MFGFGIWKWRSCLFRSISGCRMFFLWKNPVTGPLLPAVPDPIACCRALFCASQGDALKHWFWWELRHAQGSWLRVWLCGGNRERRILLLGSSVPHHQSGSSHQSKFVGSNICILVVLSNWPLYELLYCWHLKLVAAFLPPEMSLGWTHLAEPFFELKSRFKGQSLFEVSCGVRALWISLDRVCKCSSSWGKSTGCSRAPWSVSTQVCGTEHGKCERISSVFSCWSDSSDLGDSLAQISVRL